MMVPAVNAVIDGDDIVYRDYVDISIAVATPKGLVVPVLRDCDKMSYADIEKVHSSVPPPPLRPSPPRAPFPTSGTLPCPPRCRFMPPKEP